MTTSLEGVDRYEELLQRHEADGPYDYQSMFSGEGFFARRANKSRLALLKNLDEGLRAMLRPHERVLFLTSGVMYSTWENLLLLVRYTENRRALVFTTERLLLIKIDGGRRRRQLTSQIVLGAVERVDGIRFASTVVTLRSGVKYSFKRIPMSDSATLVARFKNPAQGGTAADLEAGLEHLCPRCFAVVADHPERCPRCNSPFKSPTRAGLLSLLFPGVGEAYLGNYNTALGEAVLGLAAWFTLLVDRRPDNDLTPRQVLIGRVALVVGCHLWMAASAWHAARQGHYPGPELLSRPLSPSPIGDDHA